MVPAATVLRSSSAPLVFSMMTPNAQSWVDSFGCRKRIRGDHVSVFPCPRHKPILPISTPQSSGFLPTPKHSLCTASQSACPYGFWLLTWVFSLQVITASTIYVSNSVLSLDMSLNPHGDPIYRVLFLYPSTEEEWKKSAEKLVKLPQAT